MPFLSEWFLFHFSEYSIKVSPREHREIAVFDTLNSGSSRFAKSMSQFSKTASTRDLLDFNEKLEIAEILKFNYHFKIPLCQF